MQNIIPENNHVHQPKECSQSDFLANISNASVPNSVSYLMELDLDKMNFSDLPQISSKKQETEYLLSDIQKNKLLEVSSMIDHISQQPLPRFDILGQPKIISKIKDLLFHQTSNSEQYLDINNNDLQEDIDMGIPTILKDYIRILGEGSINPIDLLIEQIYSTINDDMELSIYHLIATKEKLKSVIPIFLDRKRLGLSKDNGFVKKFEDNTKENLWVWEAPTLDMFPSEIREKAKEAREDRMGIRRKLRALLKKKEAILANDTTAELKTEEQLNSLARKELEVKEKRNRLLLKQREIEQKMNNKRNEQLLKELKEKSKIVKSSIQENSSNEGNITPPKSNLQKQKSKKKEQDLQPQTLSNEKVSKENKMLKNQQHWMLKWLKPSNQKSNSSSIDCSKKNFKSDHLLPSSSCISSASQNVSFPIAYYEDWTGVSLIKSTAKQTNWLEQMKLMPQYYQLQTTTLNNIYELQKPPLDQFSEAQLASQYLQEFISIYAQPHMKQIKNMITSYDQFKIFCLEIPNVEADGDFRSSEMSILEVSKGLYASPYCNSQYEGLSSLRSVFMNDSEWKRPSRHLLINRIPKNTSFLLPTLEELAVEYDIDSDDEWFEIHDADDLDDPKDEEEEEDELDEDDENFIVPDENIEPSPDDQITFESIFNWNWYFEGAPKSSNSLIEPFMTHQDRQNKDWLSIFGTVQDDWNSNPFLRLENDTISAKGFLEEKDIIELLKYCHGKQIPKQNLIEEFKSSNNKISKADIERKFKQYLVYEKREDKKAAWWVKEEAILLYNLSDFLLKLKSDEVSISNENIANASLSALSPLEEQVSIVKNKTLSNQQISKTYNNYNKNNVSLDMNTDSCDNTFLIVEIDSDDMQYNNNEIIDIESKKLSQDISTVANIPISKTCVPSKNKIKKSQQTNNNSKRVRKNIEFISSKQEKTLSSLSVLENDESIDSFDVFSNYHSNNNSYNEISLIENANNHELVNCINIESMNEVKNDSEFISESTNTENLSNNLKVTDSECNLSLNLPLIQLNTEKAINILNLEQASKVSLLPRETKITKYFNLKKSKS